MVPQSLASPLPCSGPAASLNLNHKLAQSSTEPSGFPADPWGHVYAERGGRGRTSLWCCCHDVSTPEVGLDSLSEEAHCLRAGPGFLRDSMQGKNQASWGAYRAGVGGAWLLCAALQRVGVVEFMTLVALSPSLLPTRANWAGQPNADPLAKK